MDKSAISRVYTLCVRILPALLMTVLYNSCSSPADPPGNPVLNGVVLDAQNEPVAGALIELEYFTDAAGVSVKIYQSPQPLAIIRFSVPEAGPVRVWISRFGVNDTLIQLMNETAMPGNYMLMWDGKNAQGRRVINHIYQNHVLYQGVDTRNNILLTGEYAGNSDPDSLETYTESDVSGNFTIRGDRLACLQDVEIERTDELGNRMDTVRLSREIRVWAIHRVHGIAGSERFTVKSDGSTNIQLHY